jgi:hypothetical protein
MSNKAVKEITALAAEMKQCKLDMDDLDLRRKPIQERYDKLRKTILPEMMEDADITGMKVAGIGTISLRDDMYVSLAAVHRDQFHLWLEDSGNKDLITSAVNAATLKAFVKQRTLDGEPLPDNLLKVQPFAMVVITK